MRKWIVVLLLVLLCAPAVRSQDAIARLPVELFRCTNFSATQTGEHELFTTETTPFMPLFVIVMLRNVAGFTSVPTISIGTNVNADNILPARALTGCDAVGEYIRIELGTSVTTGVWRGMSASDSVTLKAKVTVGAGATIYNIEVQVVGAYV